MDRGHVWVRPEAAAGQQRGGSVSEQDHDKLEERDYRKIA